MVGKEVDDLASPCPSRKPRIPEALQAVFLASNRGKEVHHPPPNGLAFKSFRRRWFPNRDRRRKSLRMSWKKNENETSCGSKPLGKQPKRLSLRSSSVAKDVSVPPAVSASFLESNPMAQNPQIFLEIMLRSRGYCTTQHHGLQTAYYNSPTSLQKASYHGSLVDMVRRNDAKQLNHFIGCGISPNPCNAHGESLVHIAARTSNFEALDVMIKHGASLRICDSMGRTPLHEACSRSKPCFRTIGRIIQEDTFLFWMADSRGSLPLSYVPKEHWLVWLDFIYGYRDTYWPRRHHRLDGTQEAPLYSQLPPNSRPLPDPYNAVPPRIAELIVSGRMTPTEVHAILHGEHTSVTTESMSQSTSVYQVSECRAATVVCRPYGDELLLGDLHDEGYCDDDDDDDDGEDDDDSIISLTEGNLSMTLKSIRCLSISEDLPRSSTFES